MMTVRVEFSASDLAIDPSHVFTEKVIYSGWDNCYYGMDQFRAMLDDVAAYHPKIAKKIESMAQLMVHSYQIVNGYRVNEQYSSNLDLMKG